MNNKKNNKNPNRRNPMPQAGGGGNQIIIILLLTMVVVMAVMYFQKTPQTKTVEWDYSTVVQKVKEGVVDEVTIVDQNIRDGKAHENINGRVNMISFYSYIPFSASGFVDLLIEHGVKVKGEENKPSYLSIILINLLPILAIGFLLWFFMFRQVQGSNNRAMSFGKSRARLLTKEDVKVTFKDVEGCKEAKEELVEVVQFLKDPAKFTKLGAKIPKGVLLVGPPGTGKTLLAKAVAGEANVPFFSMSGSEFVEMFVGVGASRVRDLFEQGKRSAPCIIFIDELDAVGRTRGAGYGGGHDEREQTLNQMLVEMDGFNTDTRIIIFAATNRPDVLDPALLRPGRFDRQVVVDLPDVKGREGIFKVHVSKIQHDPSIDLYHLARATPGFSGADIANMVNEAALIAARNDKPRVELPDFEEARDKVMMGPERRSILISEREKLNTAYHEAGHTLMAVLLQNTDSLHKVTIVPRGRSLGATWTLPSDGRYTLQRKKAIDEMSLLLGGRVAEEFKFGEDSVTTGASNDIERVTEMARRMVCEWGMSKLGPIAFGQKEQPIFLGKEIARHKDYSEETAQKIDEEVHRFVMKAYERTQRLLKENSDKFESLAKELFEKESLDIEDIERICEVKLDRVKDKLVYAGKDPKRGTDELEDSDYQDRDVKSVKEEVFNSPLKTVKKSEDEEKSTKMIKKTTSMKKINPKKKKEE